MAAAKCKECGAGFIAKRSHGDFCKTACRQAFNTRRRERGTELYDVLMSQKFGVNKPEPGLIDRLLEAYRASDTHLRGGRASWQDWGMAQTRIPMRYSAEGDKR
jgi:hypothetical protein